MIKKLLVVTSLFAAVASGCFIYPGDSLAVTQVSVKGDQTQKILNEEEALRQFEKTLISLGFKKTAEGVSASGMKIRYYEGPPTRGCQVESRGADVVATFNEGFGAKKQSDEVRDVMNALRHELSNKFGKKNVSVKFTRG